MTQKFIPYEDSDVLNIADLLEKNNSYTYKALWLLGVETGLNIKTLLSLRFSDVKKKYLYVDDQKVTLTFTAQSIIERLKRQYPDREFLFQSSHGDTPQPILHRAVQAAFAKLVPLLDYRVTLSMARKIYAIRAYKATGDKDEVRKRLGMDRSAKLPCLDVLPNPDDVLMQNEPYTLIQPDVVSLDHHKGMRETLENLKLSSTTAQQYLSLGVFDDDTVNLTMPEIVQLDHPGAVISCRSILGVTVQSLNKTKRIEIKSFIYKDNRWFVFTTGASAFKSKRKAKCYIGDLVTKAKHRINLYFKEVSEMPKVEEEKSMDHSKIYDVYGVYDTKEVNKLLMADLAKLYKKGNVVNARNVSNFTLSSITGSSTVPGARFKHRGQEWLVFTEIHDIVTTISERASEVHVAVDKAKQKLDYYFKELIMNKKIVEILGADAAKLYDEKGVCITCDAGSDADRLKLNFPRLEHLSKPGNVIPAKLLHGQTYKNAKPNGRVPMAEFTWDIGSWMVNLTEGANKPKALDNDSWFVFLAEGTTEPKVIADAIASAEEKLKAWYVDYIETKHAEDVEGDGLSSTLTDDSETETKSSQSIPGLNADYDVCSYYYIPGIDQTQSNATQGNLIMNKKIVEILGDKAGKIYMETGVCAAVDKDPSTYRPLLNSEHLVEIAKEGNVIEASLLHGITHLAASPQGSVPMVDLQWNDIDWFVFLKESTEDEVELMQARREGSERLVEYYKRPDVSKEEQEVFNRKLIESFYKEEILNVEDLRASEFSTGLLDFLFDSATNGSSKDFFIAVLDQPILNSDRVGGYQIQRVVDDGMPDGYSLSFWTRINTTDSEQARQVLKQLQQLFDGENPVLMNHLTCVGSDVVECIKIDNASETLERMSNLFETNNNYAVSPVRLIGDAISETYPPENGNTERSNDNRVSVESPSESDEVFRYVTTLPFNDFMDTPDVYGIGNRAIHLLGLFHLGSINCVTVEQLSYLERYILQKGIVVVPTMSESENRLLFKLEGI